ncbi:MAG: sugar-binding domain-containing protein [Haloarculaceae archaeon]
MSTHRTFETAPTRRRRALDGVWEFLTDPDDEGLERGYHERFPEGADEIDVPGAWNATSDYYDYEGVAWYRRTFELPDSGPTRVAFHGVCHDATVWIDGERVTEHYGGYTPFEAVADLESGVHDVVVRADSARDERSIPRPGTDWFPYGGITRAVVVESVPERFVEGVAVEYDLDGARADLTVTVDIRNLGESVEVPVGVSEFGAGAVAGERTRDGGKWSESFQADFLAEAIETARATEFVAGFAVWQFCDTRTDPRNWATRPKTKNNKGIVDEYRRPKEAYHRVRGLLREE